MKNILITAALVATVTLTACTGNEAKTDSYAGIVAAAQTAHAEAAKSGFVWKQKKMKMGYVDTYLAKAEEAKAKGDEAAAMENAKQALKTANAEILQRDAGKDLKAGWVK
jgi:hypothetical protein